MRARRAILRTVAPPLALTLALLAGLLRAVLGQSAPARTVPTAAERERAVNVAGYAPEVERPTRRDWYNGVTLSRERDLRLREETGRVVVSSAALDDEYSVQLNWPFAEDTGDGVQYVASTDGTWVVFACRAGGADGRCRGIRIDADGRRVDDRLEDRVRGRLTRSLVSVLLIAAALMATLGSILARTWSTARLLDHAAADAEWGAWAGTLVLGAEGVLHADRTRTGAWDGARVELLGQDAVVRIPAGVRLVAPAEPRIATSTAVVLVAPRTNVSWLGPRSGAADWPTGSALVVGTLEGARDRAVAAARRSLLWYGLPMTLAIATVWLGAALTL